MYASSLSNDYCHSLLLVVMAMMIPLLPYRMMNELRLDLYTNEYEELDHLVLDILTKLFHLCLQIYLEILLRNMVVIVRSNESLC